MQAKLTILKNTHKEQLEFTYVFCDISILQHIIPQSKYTDPSHDQSVMQVRFTTGEVFDNVMEIEFYN